MSIAAALWAAMLGWNAILRREFDWARHFSLTRGGLALALAVYLGLSAILLVVQASLSPLAGPAQIALSAVLAALPLAALVVSVLLTGVVLGWPAPALHLLVPGVFALSIAMLASLLVSLLPGMLGSAALALLAFMLYKLSRLAWDLPRPSAAAFAVLTVVLLVALPVALYMLTLSFDLPVGAS